MKKYSRYLFMGGIAMFILGAVMFWYFQNSKLTRNDSQATVTNKNTNKDNSQNVNDVADSQDSEVIKHEFADGHVLKVDKLDGVYFELNKNLANSYDAQVVFDSKPIDFDTQSFIFVIKKEQTVPRLARVKVNYKYPNDLTKYTAIMFSTQCYMLKPADFKKQKITTKSGREMLTYVASADKKCTFNTPKPYTQYMRFLAYEQNDYYVIYALTVKSTDYSKQDADQVFDLMQKIAKSDVVKIK